MAQDTRSPTSQRPISLINLILSIGLLVCLIASNSHQGSAAKRTSPESISDASRTALHANAEHRALMDRVVKANGVQAVVIDAETLDMTGMQLAQADLITLSGMKGLRHLILAKTNIQDADLKHLPSLSNLKFLDLSGTSVTEAGEDQLKHISAKVVR